MADDPKKDDKGKDDKAKEGDSKDELKKLVDAAVEEATSGLKARNQKLIDEKREVDTRNKELAVILEKLGGADGLERLQKMHDSLQKDELGKLLSQGKHDEWFDQRTKALRADHAQVVQKRDEEIKKLTTERDAATEQLRRKVLETEVRAACTACGVVDTAVDDVLLRAQNVFKHHKEKGIVLLDTDEGVVLGKDGKSPKSVSEWLGEQKEAARHWFPPSKGGDAQGGTAGNKGSKEPDLGNMSMADYMAYRKKQGIGSGTSIENY